MANTDKARRPGYDEERAMVRAEIAKLPAQFGLRAFPGLMFEPAHDMASFWSEVDGAVSIVIDVVQADGSRQHFGRNTREAIERELVRVTRAGVTVRDCDGGQ